MASIYDGLFDLNVRKACVNCELDLTKSDSADGPAVFLIFVLGALLVPAALLLDHIFSPSLIFHAIFWTIIALALCVGMLKPLKSYIITLQYTYRRSDWDETENEDAETDTDHEKNS